MRERLIAPGVLIALAALACTRPNPAFHSLDAGVTGGGGSGGGTGGGSGGGTGGRGGSMDASADRPPDGNPRACGVAADCIASLGDPPCGSWQCNGGACQVSTCLNCTTDADKDGYGSGQGCAGPDCDDNDPNIGSDGVRACKYTGTKGENVGVCHAGTQACVGGVFLACTGEVLPAAGEACNGVDDDCNGAVDDNLGTVTCGQGPCAKTVDACANGALTACAPAAPAATTDITCDSTDNDCNGTVDDGCVLLSCLHVASSGDDATGDGALIPFKTIQAAITYATAATGRPKVVCVAGGVACDGSSAVYQETGALTMASGVSVYGNYESTTWTRCSFGSAPVPSLTVTIAPRAATGVLFNAGVTAATILDGVRIKRADGATGSTAGVTVDAAKLVTLSNLVIDDAAAGASTYGVNLITGGQATITRSLILAGAGSTEAYGIHSVGSKPTVRDNCNAYDISGARCIAGCTATPGLGIRGRASTSNGVVGTSAAVLLQDSSGAVIDRNTLCGSQSVTGDGVRIAGASTGVVVRGNTVVVSGPTTEAHGVRMDDCGGAAPWIVSNELVQADAAAAGARLSAVGVTGNCHPVIQANQKITGAGETAGTRSVGVSCASSTGTAAVASRCAIVDNKLIQGSATSHPAQSIAVSCEGGACAVISGNIINGNGGGDVVGVSIAGGTALVERNNITGGCGSGTTTAVLTEDARARIQNNVVHGAACAAGSTTAVVSGIHVHVALGGTNETEVHSNTVDAGGAGACQGAAASLGLGAGAAAAQGRRGIFRNNILRPGGCATSYCFWEDSVGVSPRLFENNDLDPTSGPTALYLKNNNNTLSTLSGVNNLQGADGNIAEDPLFTLPPNDLHLNLNSKCANAGTTADAPARDFDNKLRDATPDIGAFER
jgi:hypothetical protein